MPKFALDDMVSLYEIMPLLSYDVEDTFKVLTDLDNSNVSMSELLSYFVNKIKQQKYNDYNGVQITDVTVSKLKAMIAR